MLDLAHLTEDGLRFICMEIKFLYVFSSIHLWKLIMIRACAYGVEPLVEKLVASGANVNSVNSFGFSCLLEACHRGFINIVRYLVKGPTPVNFAYIPSESDAIHSPFSSAPCQSALGEASRCGFVKVVQVYTLPYTIYETSSRASINLIRFSSMPAPRRIWQIIWAGLLYTRPASTIG